jgi:hypothetical protein
MSVEQAYETVPIDSVQPHPANPRRGDVDAIADSIAANGFYGALIVQRSSRHILAGNHRWRGAKQLGLSEVPVVLVDVDDERAKRILVVDNRTSDLAGWDEKALMAMLGEMAEMPEGLVGSGFDAVDLAELLAEMEGASADDSPVIGDERYTPAWVFEALGLRFDLDVAAPVDETHRVVPAERYLTIHDDGLSVPWDGLVWMNPPYSNASAWMRRLKDHPDWVCLVIVSSNTVATSELWEVAGAVTLAPFTVFSTPFDQPGDVAWPLFMAARGSGQAGLERLADQQNWPLMRPETRPRPTQPMVFERKGRDAPNRR